MESLPPEAKALLSYKGPLLYEGAALSGANYAKISLVDETTLQVLREAVRLSPENIALRRHLASNLELAGRFDEALDEYRESLRRAPYDPGNNCDVGRLLLLTNRAEEAAARFADALKHDETYAPAHIGLARALVELGNAAKARRSYERGVELDPELRDRDLEREVSPRREVEFPIPSADLRMQSFDEDEDDETEPEDGDDQLRRLGLELERPKVTFAEVGGMEPLKEEVRLNIIAPFEHPELFAAYGKTAGGGILLYGPPGCGKTFLARATAGECAARFIVVGIEDVLDMWMGQSERKLHAIFEAARATAPTILFFDELEALAGKRSDMTHSPHARAVVNQLLAEMDGAKSSNENVLVMGATNSPWHVDPAFRRPGRFDKVIFVPPPDAEARVEILRLHCANKPTQGLDYAKIAAKMKKFSGADIRATCDVAAEGALRESLKTGKVRPLTNDDFMRALKVVRPTTEEWLQTARNYALYANQTGLYDSVADYLQKGGE